MTVLSGSRTLRAPRLGLPPSLADDSVLSARSARGHVCSLGRPDRAGAPLTTLAGEVARKSLLTPEKLRS
jgi:hypothetical protein